MPATGSTRLMTGPAHRMSAERGDPVDAPAPTASTARPARRMLTHIQGLRAIAVGLVVLYHLWPARLPGGYVGVDVFFVLSGYLMTSSIVAGARSGRSVGAGLRDFYSRRVRRILPAALVVLAVTAVITLALVSRIRWAGYLHEILASTLYVENWSLAASSTDYLAAGTGASPVQHFWSLSVEEQFYLLWPVLILAVVALARHRTHRRVGRAVGARAGHQPSTAERWVPALVIGLIAVSLTYSILSTAQDSKFAYFDTFARLWEFGIGGLVAVAGGLLARVRAVAPLAAAASWLGLAGIAYSALAFSGGSPFPGWIALLPVLGAAVVVAAGEDARWGPQRLLAWRPVQFLGNISYSLYLWHWPLIVLFPTVVGNRLTTPVRIVLLVASVVVAWVSKVVIEDPFRRPAHTGGARLPAFWSRHVVLCTLVGMVVVGAGPGVGLISMTGQLSRAEAALLASRDSTPGCFGAEVLWSGGCPPAAVTLQSLTPDPLVATDDFPVQGCQQVASRGDVLSCVFGSTQPSATRVALAGDSHATQWLPALLAVATARNWRITTYVKSGCPLSTARAGDSCGDWNSAVLPELAAGDFRYVFVSARGFSGVDQDDSSDTGSYTAASMTAAFRLIGGRGAEVVAIRDIPQPANAGIANVPACVYGNAEPTRCVFAETRATRYDLMPAAVAADPGSRLLDMNKYFCTDNSCPSVIGNVLVYLDGGHMTATYSRSLAGPLGAELAHLGIPAP